jgi:hypothetical protein
VWLRIRRLAVIALMALVGRGVGWFVGAMIGESASRSSSYPLLAELHPLPHHVPKYAGGVSFRFAMVHDIIHERYPKHGSAHYRERDRLTREKLAKLAPDDPARFSLADDLAAGLERLGRSDEAVVVMRDKLARQQEKGLTGRALYTSYANLGTFLIHAASPKAIAGDLAAREQFKEGIGFVRKSVEVNPEAHFGREQWQLVIAEFILNAMEHSGRLGWFDFVGNRLDLDIEPILNREANWTGTGYGRPTDALFSQGRVADAVPAFFQRDASLDDPTRWLEFSPIRQHITKVGGEEWDGVPVLSHRASVPFDEPVLGIIGMAERIRISPLPWARSCCESASATSRGRPMNARPGWRNASGQTRSGNSFSATTAGSDRPRSRKPCLSRLLIPGAGQPGSTSVRRRRQRRWPTSARSSRRNWLTARAISALTSSTRQRKSQLGCQ